MGTKINEDKSIAKKCIFNANPYFNTASKRVGRLLLLSPAFFSDITTCYRLKGAGHLLLK